MERQTEGGQQPALPWSQLLQSYLNNNAITTITTCESCCISDAARVTQSDQARPGCC